MGNVRLINDPISIYRNQIRDHSLIMRMGEGGRATAWWGKAHQVLPLQKGGGVWQILATLQGVGGGHKQFEVGLMQDT